MVKVTFWDSKGNQILGTILIPKQAGSVVIVSHGFSSSKERKLYVELQHELNRAGIGTLRYDYYGHGQLYCKRTRYTVTKDVTLSKCVDSLKAAIALVRSKGDYDIGLMGSSFGGLISVIASSQDSEIKALALKSPVTEPIEFWKQRLGDERIEKWKQEGIMHYNERGEDFELNYAFWEDLITYNALEMAKNITCPVLIVHGGSDSVVPIRQSQDLAKIFNTDVRVVKGANHDYAEPRQYDEMKKLIIDFLVEKLSILYPLPKQPPMRILPRSSSQDKLKIEKNNHVITVSKKKFLKQYRLTNVIRLRPEEYAAIPPNAQYLTLFNLQHTNHQPGKRYALPVIITPGYYRKNQENLPVLSFQNCLVGECVTVKNGVSYQELSIKDFTHSLTNIRNILQLQRHLLKKYRQSLPDLSIKELVQLGVALTTVKIISRWEEYLKRL